ncbi:MAG TPA: restriction endonuclease fold toxin-2 domain-containing protein [Cellulomonas sp.]
MIVAATLATCADPCALVPGEPVAIERDATVLDEQLRVLVDARTDTAAVAPEGWSGEACDAWTTHRGSLTDVLDVLGSVHETAAAVLRNHAAVLRWAQGRAEVAVALWDEGRTRTLAWQRSGGGLPTVAPGSSRSLLGGPPSGPGSGSPVRIPPTTTDPGAGHRALAEQVLASARAEVDSSESVAARLLDELSAGIPDGRWHLGEFLSGIGGWFADVAATLWRLSSVRAVIDPDGYRTSATGIVDDAVDTYWSAAHDPFSTTERLLDLPGLHDSPARWWGGLVPDLAVTLATGPAGRALAAAGRGARGVGAGARVAAGYQPGGAWAVAAARQGWVDDLRAGPTTEPGKVRMTLTAQAPWADFQRTWAGPDTFKLTGEGRAIWSDGVHVDPDAVVAIEAKYIRSPGNSIYEGSAPKFVMDNAMRQFDEEIGRYASVIRDEANPVARLRIVTSTDAAAAFLRDRVVTLIGPDIDLHVEVR